MTLVRGGGEKFKMDSILDSVKKLLGIQADYTVFDADLIIHINSVFVILQQLGVGPSTGYYIEDASDIWDSFITDVDMHLVKSYMYLKVRLMFDPPTSTALIESMERIVSELEWRLYVVGSEGGE